MVGWSADALQQADLPLYWPPEQVPEYQRRQAERLGPDADGAAHRRGGVDVRRGLARWLPAGPYRPP